MSYTINESNVDTLTTMELQYTLMLTANGERKPVMHGYKGAKDAEELVAGVSALFAGGELSENDKDAVMSALQDAYWMAKERNKEKYTPKKYRKSIEVE